MNVEHERGADLYVLFHFLTVRVKRKVGKKTWSAREKMAETTTRQQHRKGAVESL